MAVGNQITMTVGVFALLSCSGENVKVYQADTFTVASADGRELSSGTTTRRIDSTAQDSILIESWLLLRRAAELPDSQDRAALYRQVTLPVAKDRIPWLEAQKREQLRDYAGALVIYENLEAPISRLRMRFFLAADDSSKMAIRRELLALVQTTSAPSAVREGYQVFDQLFSQRTPQEEHNIARSAADIGVWARAEQGFAKASAAHLLTNTDRVRYATALFRLRRFRDAAAQFEKVTTPRTLQASARYQRARAFVALGQVTEAKRQLREIQTTYSTDTSAAAALTLLADLEGDAGRDRSARTLFREIIQRFPNTRFGRAARINTALTSFVLGEYQTAAAEFRAISNPADSALARYWLGRTRERLGDTEGARQAWRDVLRLDSLSYYGGLAARRLGVQNMHDIAGQDIKYPTVLAVDTAVRRIAALRVRDMTEEIHYENDRLFKDALESHERMLATAAAFANTDQAGRAIALGRRVLDERGPSAAVYRLIYPVAARDTIVVSANKAGIDPILIASLIRQESNFNPRAVSPVGARGLMQLMPSVAAKLAVQYGIRPWTESKLDDPGINIMLGVAHLAPLLRKYPHEVRALAAYNAGESRVTRWVTKAGADDPELFTERIPYAETRGYVKSILRNREVYRALYTW